MKVLECNEPNDNISFLYDIINNMNIDKLKYKWVISDLDLVPIFHGDYSGIGREESESVSYNFIKRIEKEKVIVINSDELFTILKDTQTIRNGVFICLAKEYDIETNTYRPRVESNKSNQMYDERAKYEIRILDGDIFFIF